MKIKIKDLRKLNFQDKLYEILKINKIHDTAVKYATEASNGNVLIQSEFDCIVREFSIIDGRYLRSVGKRDNLYEADPT